MPTPSPKPTRLTASMRWAPTTTGPPSPMPMRFIRPSCERLLCVRVALLHLSDRIGLAAIFILDVGGNRPLLALQQLQHLFDRRVALAPRHVVALILLPV